MSGLPTRFVRLPKGGAAFVATLDEDNSMRGVAPRTWKLSADGVIVTGEDAARRTPGQPVTMQRIAASFGGLVTDVTRAVQIATGCRIPREMVLAVIAAESRGRPDAERIERKIHDRSIGLMQLLTRTAAGLGAKGPAEPFAPEWTTLLGDPATNVDLGVRYLARALNGAPFDPVLLYAAYNAGSTRAAGTPWGVLYHRQVDKDGKVIADAMDSFVAWFGDACAVLGGGGAP